MSFSLTKSPRVGIASKSFLSSGAKALSLRPKQQLKSASRLTIEANELNKWADHGAMDDHYEGDQFDREVGQVVLKVLTAKAVQRLLVILGEYDLIVQNWFHQWCAEHPPTTGNAFVDELMQCKGVVIHDNPTQSDHSVDPQNLAHRILQMRSDMSTRLAGGMIRYTELENMGVIRKHLERATYMSGSHEQGGQSKGRRGYYGGGRRNVPRT